MAFSSAKKARTLAASLRLSCEQSDGEVFKKSKKMHEQWISIGNTSEPTIDFQGTFVRFPVSIVYSTMDSLLMYIIYIYY